jgi:hypothetical protein
VTVGRRSAARWDVHIDHTEAAICLVARHCNRVGVSNDADMLLAII